ncbi:MULTISPECIES: hypothetical protein [Streptomyces]|uniref:Uncharacterized protein n=2 Tax=Streptomyces TaxID=1883 RepID=A0ABD5JS50_9ACTN|nr:MULTISPECIES: hypothetical protein [unclassified Streptomyces]MEE4589929.1 hypothetical protein [Streptomyces sp. DSM 41602]WTA78630.1 hypothetical protein OG751_00605 [Streptomyces antimycoticus]QTI87333.1 hypothetical protein AS97_40400 [Streptomyces sp. AgN23]RSS38030.1 hypothetical protein EF902_31305 [Streptomyces sp. WAC05858]WTB02881.1 hypothetical protein OG546_00550 [Streptomyces antimycoticus]
MVRRFGAGGEDGSSPRRWTQRAATHGSSPVVGQRIGDLMGQLRDFEQMVPDESVQQLTAENTTLKRWVQQLSQEHRALQGRLEGSRSNLRFADKRIADLEAQVLELQQSC